VTVVQTVLIYVVIPAAVYGLLALLTLWPKFARAPRYRPGQPWTYPPVWWTGSDAAEHTSNGVVPALTDTHGRSKITTAMAQTSVQTAWGGARGTW
jgi:hypothetical protein